MTKARVFEQIAEIQDPQKLAAIGQAIGRQLEKVLLENPPQIRVEEPKPDRAEP
jgi:hypothetical protein